MGRKYSCVEIRFQIFINKLIKRLVYKSISLYVVIQLACINLNWMIKIFRHVFNNNLIIIRLSRRWNHLQTSSSSNECFFFKFIPLTSQRIFHWLIFYVIIFIHRPYRFINGCYDVNKSIFVVIFVILLHLTQKISSRSSFSFVWPV